MMAPRHPQDHRNNLQTPNFNKPQAHHDGNAISHLPKGVSLPSRRGTPRPPLEPLAVRMSREKTEHQRYDDAVSASNAIAARPQLKEEHQHQEIKRQRQPSATDLDEWSKSPTLSARDPSGNNYKAYSGDERDRDGAGHDERDDGSQESKRGLGKEMPQSPGTVSGSVERPPFSASRKSERYKAYNKNKFPRQLPQAPERSSSLQPPRKTASNSEREASTKDSHNHIRNTATMEAKKDLMKSVNRQKLTQLAAAHLGIPISGAELEQSAPRRPNHRTTSADLERRPARTEHSPIPHAHPVIRPEAASAPNQSSQTPLNMNRLTEAQLRRIYEASQIPLAHEPAYMTGAFPENSNNNYQSNHSRPNRASYHHPPQPSPAAHRAGPHNSQSNTQAQHGGTPPVPPNTTQYRPHRKRGPYSSLRTWSHCILPFLIILLFIITSGIVLGFSIQRRSPIPPKMVEGIWGSFAILISALCVCNMLLLLRGRKKIDEEGLPLAERASQKGSVYGWRRQCEHWFLTWLVERDMEFQKKEGSHHIPSKPVSQSSIQEIQGQMGHAEPDSHSSAMNPQKPSGRPHRRPSNRLSSQHPPPSAAKHIPGVTYFRVFANDSPDLSLWKELPVTDFLETLGFELKPDMMTQPNVDAKEYPPSSTKSNPEPKKQKPNLERLVINNNENEFENPNTPSQIFGLDGHLLNPKNTSWNETPPLSNLDRYSQLQSQPRSPSQNTSSSALFSFLKSEVSTSLPSSPILTSNTQYPSGQPKYTARPRSNSLPSSFLSEREDPPLLPEVKRHSPLIQVPKKELKLKLWERWRRRSGEPLAFRDRENKTMEGADGKGGSIMARKADRGERKRFWAPDDILIDEGSRRVKGKGKGKVGSVRVVSVEEGSGNM